MLKGHDFQQSNGLSIRVDWLSFTILDSTLPNSIISMLGYSREFDTSIKEKSLKALILR